jgi:hypothetical protein
MALELVLEDKLGAGLLVQLDIVVSCYRKGLAVGGEGMIGYRVVEKMVDFRTRHDGQAGCDRSSSLLSPETVEVGING